MTKIPGEPTPRDLRRELNELRREVQRLRHTRTDELTYYREREVVFSYPGTPLVNEVSPPYLIRDLNGDISRVDIAVLAPGTTKTVVQVTVTDSDNANPKTIDVTIPAGDRYVADEGFDLSVEEFDTMTVKPTTVGAGVSSITVAVMLTVSDEE
jgi:hypothetical protein